MHKFMGSWMIALLSSAAISAAQCENVFLITLDGFRWQELFTGAEAALISKDGGVPDTNRLAAAFWREDPLERRRALMPFFWEEIARGGQLYGNRALGSAAHVTNGKNFTYPGFNEILAGFADDRITNNAKIYNENVTVFEWLHRKAAFTNRVAAFANWDVFPFIMNAQRAGIPIWTGYREGTLNDAGAAIKMVTALAQDITPVWDGMNFDVFFHHAAREYARERKPRLVWIAYSETDEWAHEGRYDLYLSAANRIDGYIRALWQTVQTIPEYRNKTAFILTTDHGRGTGPTAWKDHGAEIEGAQEIWIAALGAGVPALGERRNVPRVGQNQIAATIAAWLGEDYHKEVPKAGEPITELLGH